MSVLNDLTTPTIFYIPQSIPVEIAHDSGLHQLLDILEALDGLIEKARKENDASLLSEATIAKAENIKFFYDTIEALLSVFPERQAGLDGEPLDWEHEAPQAAGPEFSTPVPWIV